MKNKSKVTKGTTRKADKPVQPASKSPLSDAALMRFFLALLHQGYTDEVRSYTTTARPDVKEVARFARFFLLLIEQSLIPFEPQTVTNSWAGTPDQEQAMALVCRSLEEMDDFFGELSEGIYTGLIMTDHGQDMQVEVGWQDDRAGWVVWDRWTVVVDDPVIAFADAAGLFNSATWLCEPKPAEEPLSALYHYHPERFKACRTYADTVGKFYRHQVDPVSGSLTLEQSNDLMRPVMEELSRRAMHYPRKLKEKHPHPSLVAEAEFSLATAYGRFVQAGRQIMDFPPALTAMLAHTDIDDIALNQITLPYPAQYLYFGPQAALELAPGWMVDGAYVESGGVAGDVRFTVTAVPQDPHSSRDWYLFPEPHYSQDFVETFRSMDLATAIDTVLAEKMHHLHQTEAKPGGNITDPMAQRFDEQGIPFPPDLTLMDVSPELATERLAMEARRHPVYRLALQLVVNALCYVTAYPDDMATSWPKGTPMELVKLFLEGKGKEQQRAKSKLAALGYVPVHICGSHLVQMQQLQAAHGVGVHWRRGHWRNQAHGPARTLRKLIWVTPVMVGVKPEQQEPELGHLYLVS